MNTHTRIASEIEGFRINGVSPFWSPADAADAQLEQAHALLTLLSGAHRVCDDITSDQADQFDNLRHGITASALDGIATLIALAQFQTDEARRTRQLAGAQPIEPTPCPVWDSALAAYAIASERLAGHEREPACKAKAGTPECDAYEAHTDLLANQHAVALIAMVLTPAPDRDALATKVETYAKVVGGDAWDRGDEMIAQIAADTRRLAGRA